MRAWQGRPRGLHPHMRWPAMARVPPPNSSRRRLSGDNRYASIAGYKHANALGAKTQALAEDTFFAGLRRAGVPEE